MDESKHETGLLMVLLQRLEQRRLPMALALKEKVEKGGVLNNSDDRFLAEVRRDLRKSESLLERHPEFRELITGLADSSSSSSYK